MSIAVEVGSCNRRHVRTDWINRRLGKTGKGTSLGKRRRAECAQHSQQQYKHTYFSHWIMKLDLDLAVLSPGEIGGNYTSGPIDSQALQSIYAQNHLVPLSFAPSCPSTLRGDARCPHYSSFYFFQNNRKSSASTTYPPATASGTDPIQARRLTFEAKLSESPS